MHSSSNIYGYFVNLRVHNTLTHNTFQCNLVVGRDRVMRRGLHSLPKYCDLSRILLLKGGFCQEKNGKGLLQVQNYLLRYFLVSLYILLLLLSVF